MVGRGRQEISARAGRGCSRCGDVWRSASGKGEITVFQTTDVGYGNCRIRSVYSRLRGRVCATVGEERCRNVEFIF